MKGPGIYAIRRIGTDQRCVGSTANVARRWTTHRRDLNAGTHHASRLQNAWAKRIAALVAYHERRRNGLAV